jgi:hypothetical protein
MSVLGTLAFPSSGNSAARNAVSLILSVVERLHATVAAENDEIHRRCSVNYDDYNLRKSQGLLELNRLMPLLGVARGAPNLREALTKLHAALDENQRLLRVQLSAARKVSTIIADAIHEGQSDGTYSAQSWRDWQ